MRILKAQVNGPLPERWGSKPEYPGKKTNNQSENGYHALISSLGQTWNTSLTVQSVKQQVQVQSTTKATATWSNPNHQHPFDSPDSRRSMKELYSDRFQAYKVGTFDSPGLPTRADFILI